MKAIFGVVELARLAWVTRAWRRGRYLRWRYQTAFGRGAPRTTGDKRRAALEFGLWARRMRRLAR